MFTWILIAFAIALIFGVIKIEQLKSLAEKAEPKMKELWEKIVAKSNELKTESSKKENTEENKKDSAE